MDKKNKFSFFGENKKAGKAGSYTVIMSILLLAALIVVNLIVASLPPKFTRIDTTSSKMYTLSETTERFVSGISEDITFWFICPGGQENAELRTFIDRYAGLSSHITVKVADPIADPEFIAAHTDDSPSASSVIVESARRSKTVDYNDLYYYFNQDYGKMTAEEYSMYSQYYAAYGFTADPYFDGDNQFTSAIEYVIAEKLPTLYALAGHGEQEWSQTLAYYANISGYKPQQLNIALDGNDIPDDCSCIMIFAPELDITDAELAKLSAYLKAGGNIFMISRNETPNLKNFSALGALCGIEIKSGLINEGDSASYYPGYPYYIYPTLSSTHTAVSMLTQNQLSVLTSESHPLVCSADAVNGYTLTPLLTTSDKAFLKQTDGTKTEASAMTVAVAAENGDTSSKLIWLSSAGLASDTFINATNGGNLYCFLNMLTWLCNSFKSTLPEISAVDIGEATLSVPESSANIWSFIFIFLIPGALTVAGLVYWTKRRKK